MLMSVNTSRNYLGHGKTETVYESLYMNYKAEMPEESQMQQFELF